MTWPIKSWEAEADESLRGDEAFPVEPFEQFDFRDAEAISNFSDDMIE